MTEYPLADFEEQIRLCREHLAKSDDKDSLKPLFVRLLLVGACGAYEKTMRGAVEKRANESTDKEFVQYLGKAAQRHGLPFDSISIYRLMRPKGRHVLDRLISNNAMETYEKLVKQRHAVAHGEETDVRWEEMQHMHDVAKEVPLTFTHNFIEQCGP